MRRFFAAAVFLAASFVVFAQQTPPPQQPSPQPPPAQPRTGATPPAKPIVPVAVSTVLANPDTYVGEYISLTAPVETSLTKSTFSVDQDKTKPEKEILIIAPTLTGTVDPN